MMGKVVFLQLLAGLVLTSSLLAQSYVPERSNRQVRVDPVADINAFAFSLKDVRLLEGSPFKAAMDKDAAYLLFLEPDRLLHRFHTNAGLDPRGEVYGGWESEGLSGHTLGHYLSACAMMYSATGDERFADRVDYIVKELIRCQKARGTGYIGAIPDEDKVFAKVAAGDIKTGGFDLNGAWSPWYTVHKVMSGLFDAYLLCGNKTALKALRGMADWTDTTLQGLTEDQLQQMLKCEYGGMNDVLANLYALTGKKKYLDLSYKFYDDFVMQPLAEKTDPLPGKHANTNIPKAIGSARQYELTGRPADQTIASFFWESVVDHHTYVIGGNSNYEYCGEPGKLNDRLSDNTCETCNTYNMLKLTRHLFAWEPGAKLGDYYERALYNHILASQNSEDGMMSYFVPLRMGAKKTFSDSVNTFTCCVGSGMENHTKYAEGIYYEGKDGSLIVNLFIPSELSWKSRNVMIRQETGFPTSDRTQFTVSTKKKQRFPLKIRHPNWAAAGIQFSLNGNTIEAVSESADFYTIDREWENGDLLELTMPMHLFTESMPDNPERIAILYGPLVLAGQLGDTLPDPVYGVPVLLTDNKNVQDWITPVTGEPLSFQTNGVGQPFDLKLVPFYQTYREHYSVYWDYFTKQDWGLRQEAYEKDKKEQQEIEAKTIDYFRIGEMQPERDHNLIASERSYVEDALGVPGREARADNFFQFEMHQNGQPATDLSLLFTYIGDDKKRKFDILVNGQKIATEELTGGETGKFYNRVYPLPQALVTDQEKVTVRIEANYGRTAGRIFGARLIRN